MASLREQLLAARGPERERLKAEAVAQQDLRGKHTRRIRDVDVEIEVLASRVAEVKSRTCVELMVRAWRGGKPLGFGKGGTVEIERFRIFSPPTSVRRDGVIVSSPAEAAIDCLCNIVRAVGKSGGRIDKGKVGRTTSTFFSDAHPESTTVDGDVMRLVSEESWSAVRDGAGTHVQDTAGDAEAAVRISSGTTTDLFTAIERGFHLFDTSALPDTDVISAASLHLRGREFATAGGAWDLSLGVYSSNPASNTALATGDYNSVGDTPFSDSPLLASDGVIDAYNEIPFNATGIAAIDKEGITKLSCRIVEDAEDTPPPWGASRICFFRIDFADAAGTSQDPMFVVEHEAGGGAVEATGDLTAPMAVADGTVVVAVTATGALTAPMATAAATVAVQVAVTGAMTAPMATLAGSVGVGVALSATLTAPMATVAGELDVTVGLTGALTAPMATLSAAAQVAVTLQGDLAAPMATVSGTVRGPAFVSGDLTAPMVTAAGTIAVDQVERAVEGALVAPMATFAGAVGVGAGLSGALTAPMPTITGSVTVDARLSGAIVAPMATLAATATVTDQEDVAIVGNLTAPMCVLSGIIRHKIKFPTSARIKGSANSVRIKSSLTSIRTPNQ